MSDKFEITTLVRKLNKATEQYDLGQPIMTDKEWDDLYFKLQEMEKETGIVLSNSPTNIIYWLKADKLDKTKHDHPMLSLDKTKNVQDINSFLKGQPFVGMFKMDGLTCSLTYENGFLVKAETRGNGIEGEDITHNIVTVKEVPVEIPYKEKLVVDGEVICRKDDFTPFKDEYKNPRNFAAGSIRLLSSKECQKRNLSFIAWEMIEGYPEIKEFWQRLEQLNNIGFTIVPMVCDRQWVDEALEVLQEEFKEEHAIYPIDGYVFKFNNVDFGKKQGQTDHHLKNAIAYKLYDETYTTRLKNIQWTMGRTGILTPVAIFDSIDIDGSIVEKASLHNVSVMKEILGDCAYVGEPLQVYKANQIIPQIAEAGPKYDYDYVITHDGVSANDVIERCPICSGGVVYITSEDGVINAYCDNPLCEGKLINRLEHFCGKKGLDIKGLSKATFQKLIDWGWINNIEDIFNLNQYRNEWIKKPGFGTASVDKILKSIEEHKHTTIDAFISAIGIPLIGQTAAKSLANHFKTYEEFRAAVKNNNYYFFTLYSFGEEMDYQLKHFDYSEMDNLSKILILETTIVNNKIINNNLKRKTIVITGKLTNFKNRNELKSIIEKNGGKVVGSISSKTDILINNDVNSTSSKNKTAQKLGIPIISETDFIEQYLEK